MSEKELERIKREYTLQIKPLIDYALKIPGTPKHTRIISQNFEEIMDRSLKIDQIYGYMAQHIDFLREELGRMAESNVRDMIYFFSVAFSYLGIVEITGNFLADFVILHLIISGHDFHVESTYRTPRIKHLVYLKKLEEEKVPLATKLNFIEDCGITVFKSFIDTRLRNDIAHMNFEIKENVVYIRGKPAVDMIFSSLPKILAALDAHEALMKEAASDHDTKKQLDR